MGDTPTNRPAPAASGTLAKTPLIHLLIYAFEKKLDGTIELVALGRKAILLFIAGEPAKVQTDEPATYLGQVLTDLGYLPEDVRAQSMHDLSMAGAGPRVLHGEWLLRNGVIDAAKLEIGLREQVVRKLHHVATMPPETTYAYYHGFDALQDWGGAAPHGIDPFPLLWGLLHEAVPRGHVDAALARVDGASLRIAKGADLARLGLGAIEHAAAELLRLKRMTVSEFPRVSGLGDEEARLLTYLLLVTKQVDVITAGHRSRSSAPPRTTVPPRTSAPPRMSGFPYASAPPRTSQPPRSSLPPHSTTAPPSPRTAVSQVHLSGGSTVAQQAAARAVSRSGRALEHHRRSRAHDRPRGLLHHARSRARRDLGGGEGELLRAREEVASGSLAAGAQPRPGGVLAGLRANERSSLDAARIQDRYARYMRLLAEGSGSPEMQETVARVVEAATDFQKAEVCFKRQDYAQAEALCRKAVKADTTQPEYQAMLAWLISLKPESQTPEKVAECIQMLDRAIGMSDRCERGYFWRGHALQANRAETTPPSATSGAPTI